MHFGFALELSDIDLWNIDLLDTHLNLLDTDIFSKQFFLSSRHLEDVHKTYFQDVFKTCLEDMSSNMSLRRLRDMSLRRLEDIFSVIFLLFQAIFKMSSIALYKAWRHLGRPKIVTLKTCLRQLQDVSKTNNFLLREEL